jgi:hypothetical protein
MKSVLFFLLSGSVCLTSCLFPKSSHNAGDETSEKSRWQKPLTDNDSIKAIPTLNQLHQEKEIPDSNEWKDQTIENGQLPDCYSLNAFTGDIDNYLEVSVGGNSDVCIKVMNQRTERCNRFVFVNRGSTYRITNIPEGKYYLKIAYGKKWASKDEQGKCVGKFMESAIYKKGEDILDFYIKYTNTKYTIPSFRLELDIIQSDTKNSFNSQSISENEFNI